MPLGRVIPWADAPHRIASLVSAIHSAGRGVVLGISGPVGAGKSTLAQQLSACILRTDDYLPDYDDLPEHDRDDPLRADLASLSGHLEALRAGVSVHAPMWSFKTHRREGARLVHPAPLIVCEGIHALHATVRRGLDIAVFVDAPRDRRWARWEAIETAGERGWGVEHARNYFDAVAEPTFARYAADYRTAAQLVVINDGPDPLR